MNGSCYRLADSTYCLCYTEFRMYRVMLPLKPCWETCFRASLRQVISRQHVDTRSSSSISSPTRTNEGELFWPICFPIIMCSSSEPSQPGMFFQAKSHRGRFTSVQATIDSTSVASIINSMHRLYISGPRYTFCAFHAVSIATVIAMMIGTCLY